MNITQSVFAELWMLHYDTNAGVHPKCSLYVYINYSRLLKDFRDLNFVSIDLYKVYLMTKF